jgi:geranylgeranyl diphosphate synthase type II
VHDDLPCFDDSSLRRGRPSVHRAYGERVAVLTGDALIVLAFQTLARVGDIAPARLAVLLPAISRCVGSPAGIVAGQAWECEPEVALSEYQRAKTGALFAAAAMAGAASAGADAQSWYAFGERIGEAFQIADDLRDVAASQDEVGKPVHRDEALGRPNAAEQLGVAGALQRLEQLLAEALELVPECPGKVEFKLAVVAEAQRFLPRKLARRAA